MAEPNGQKKDFLDKALDIWWGKCAVGAASIGTAVWLYVRFSAFESGEAQAVKATRAVRAMYEIGGKWTPVLVFGVIGVAAFAWGVKQFLSGRE